jgi:hypothetical protein
LLIFITGRTINGVAAIGRTLRDAGIFGLTVPRVINAAFGGITVPLGPKGTH